MQSLQSIILKRIIIALIANIGFLYVSYLDSGRLKLSFLQIFFGMFLPVVLIIADIIRYKKNQEADC